MTISKNNSNIGYSLNAPLGIQVVVKQPERMPGVVIKPKLTSPVFSDQRDLLLVTEYMIFYR